MMGSFRQSIAWLHTWGGLVFGWLLAAIFVAGTISVFAQPVTKWMKSAPAAQSAEQRIQAVAHAAAFIAQQASAPERWSIYLPDDSVSWTDASGESHDANFDRVNGGPRSSAQTRETTGGHHFVAFHYGLHAGLGGILLVGFVTMAMLVALVSGVITHRRIFKDIFTLRLGKGQRSWLDGHNVASVLTLPFQLVIAYTGLAVFHYAWMPAAIAFHYGMPGGLQGQFDHVGPYFEARAEHGPPPPAGSRDTTLAHIPDFVREAEARSGLPVEWLSRRVEDDGNVSIRIGMGAGEATALPAAPAPVYRVVGSPARLFQESTESSGTGETALDVMTVLHFGHFGGWTVKWVWFLSGIAGFVMVATGLLLFTVKRRARGDVFGAATPSVFRAIDALNVAAVAGVMLASIAYLWGNRLLPLDLPARGAAEIRVFFVVWALTLVHGLLRPRRAWAEQFGTAALMCLALPLLNAVTTGDWFVRQAARGDWTGFGVEITAMAIGVMLAALSLRAAGVRR